MKSVRQIKKEQDVEKFLELLRQGKSRKEAYESVGHEKTWASKVITELKKKEPERLKGISEEIEATPKTSQKPHTATKMPQPIKYTPKEEKRVYGANTKPQKQSFSFRAEQTKIESWKLYAETVGGDVGMLWTAAIDEYINNHRLTADQQVLYDLKKQVLEKQKELSANKV